MTMKVESSTQTPEQIASSVQAMEARRAGNNVAEPAAAAVKTEERAESTAASGTAEKQEETEAHDAEASEEDEGEEGTQEGNADPAQKPRKKGGFQKRIEKLNKRVSASEERAIRAEERARLLEEQASKGLKTQETKQLETKVEPVPGEPKADDFENHGEYVKALSKWTLKQERETESKRQFQKQVQEAGEKLKVSHHQRVAEAIKTHADYDEVVAELAELEVPGPLVGMIYAHENSGELTYHLAKNPDEFKRICGLDPVSAARALGKFEAKHLPDPAEKAPAKEVKTTKTPDPISTVRAGGGTSTVKDLSKLSFADFKRERERAEKARAGR